MSLFTPPCSSWKFTVLKQSRITSLTLGLTWARSIYIQAERSLIFSRLAKTLQASLKFLSFRRVTHLLDVLGFMARLPLLQTFHVLPWTWKADLFERSITTFFPLVLTMETISVLTMETISAPADLVFSMFSRSWIVPRLRTIFLAFVVQENGGLHITTTAASIA